MPRTRTGCVTCKRRHRKCDETKPTCKQCAHSGLECGGYGLKLQWGIGIASRGRFRGETAPVLPSAEVRRSPPAVRATEPTFTTDAFSRSFDLPPASPSISGQYGMTQMDSSSPDNYWTAEQGRDLIGSFASSLPHPDRSKTSSLAALDATTQAIFDQCNETTLLYLYSTATDDPFREYLRRQALQSETLFNILLATHIYHTSSGDLPPRFFEYYSRGLGWYREDIKHVGSRPKAGLLLAGMFVCDLHLFQATPWTPILGHLCTVHNLVDDTRAADMTIDPELRSPVEALAMMDIPTFVRGRQVPTLGLWRHLRGGNEAMSDRQSGMETISGLPRTLLDIFANIADQSSEKRFVEWPGEVGDVPHLHLWEAYRLAGILTGRRFRGGMRDPISTEILVCRLMATLDALYRTSRDPIYNHILAKNSSFYPCTAVRLEVALLHRRPEFLQDLHVYQSSCGPYHRTPNGAKLYELLDVAMANHDDDMDLDGEARRHGVELSLF